MRLAFYAPLKAPTHPVPSGDRRMGRLLIEALTLAGHEVELAATFRSYHGAGDPVRIARLAEVGDRLARRLARRYLDRPDGERPQAWLTYHLYYKAPDWLGPRVADALGIPYLVAEASVANKRADGPWARAHAAVVAALAQAQAVITLNPADEEGVRPHLAGPERSFRLLPFLDPLPFASAARARADHRLRLARRLGLPADQPWLIAVAMMRAPDKLASYRLLGAALAGLRDHPWRLVAVGDGPARAAVEAALAPLGPGRVCYTGQCDEEALPGLLAAADLFVWPAINEAYGMAILEAQAAGLPVVAGDSGGVAAIVADGLTGRLVPSGDAAAFAAAVAALIDAPERCRALGETALAQIAERHGLAAAAGALDRILGREPRA